MSKHPVKWADQAMFEAAPMQRNEDGRVVPRVALVSATPDPLGAIAAACRMYKGIPTYSLGDITDAEREDYWEQVKKTHLKAPLEFVDLHFFIEGVTRSFTHQMVRQRTAVYAQESMRFAVKENLSDEAAVPPGYDTWTADMKGQWKKVMDNIQETYNHLVANGVPAEDARGLLPHATTTRLNYKTNLRNLLEHAGNRLCTQAQFEWRAVFFGMIKAITEHESTYSSAGEVTSEDASWQWELIGLDESFAPVCYQLGRCQFMADFDRQCTIRERVQNFAEKGVPSTHWSLGAKREKISPAEWLLDPTAGRRD